MAETECRCAGGAECECAKKGGSSWPGFIVGTALGAALGVFFAPDRGAESRRKLERWIKEKRDSKKEQILSKREQVESAVRVGRNAYNEADRTPVEA